MVSCNPQPPRRAICFIGRLRDWCAGDASIEGVGDPAQYENASANRFADALELPGFEVV
jgi:hypothetical protein